MKVEVTEKKLRDAGFNLAEGDTITVPDEIGKAWCRRGWAKDVDGKVPTGPRIVRGAVVQPDPGTIGSSSSLEG